MKVAIRTLAELGEDVVLAPERWLAAHGSGVPLGELVRLREERPGDVARAVVFDTTHAKDGVLDVGAALRERPPARSAKKSARAGDLVISRLRPYLRQIAYVHPQISATRELAFSTEFYVLSPRSAGGGGIAWLLPFLLSDDTQAALAAAQEGGHHPRVPRETLLALRVPAPVVARRAVTTRKVLAALDAQYAASEKLRDVLGGEGAAGGASRKKQGSISE